LVQGICTSNYRILITLCLSLQAKRGNHLSLRRLFALSPLLLASHTQNRRFKGLQPLGGLI